MDLTPVFLSEAELNRDYWVELRWWDGDTPRRPTYRARIIDKNRPDGKVKLARETMGPHGTGSTAWDSVEHPTADLFIYELPYQPSGPEPPARLTASES